MIQTRVGKVKVTHGVFSVSLKRKKIFSQRSPHRLFCGNAGGGSRSSHAFAYSLCRCTFFYVCVWGTGAFWRVGSGDREEGGDYGEREREREREGERGIKRGGKISERDEGYILSQLIKYIYNTLYHINMRAGGPGAAGLFIQAWFGNNVQEYRSVYIHF